MLLMGFLFFVCWFVCVFFCCCCFSVFFFLTDLFPQSPYSSLTCSIQRSRKTLKAGDYNQITKRYISRVLIYRSIPSAKAFLRFCFSDVNEGSNTFGLRLSFQAQYEEAGDLLIIVKPQSAAFQRVYMRGDRPTLMDLEDTVNKYMNMLLRCEWQPHLQQGVGHR